MSGKIDNENFIKLEKALNKKMHSGKDFVLEHISINYDGYSIVLDEYDVKSTNFKLTGATIQEIMNNADRMISEYEVFEETLLLIREDVARKVNIRVQNKKKEHREYGF